MSGLDASHESQLREAAMAYADAIEPRYKVRGVKQGTGTIIRLHRQAYAAFLKGADWQADYRERRKAKA